MTNAVLLLPIHQQLRSQRSRLSQPTIILSRQACNVPAESLAYQAAHLDGKHLGPPFRPIPAIMPFCCPAVNSWACTLLAVIIHRQACSVAARSLASSDSQEFKLSGAATSSHARYCVGIKPNALAHPFLLLLVPGVSRLLSYFLPCLCATCMRVIACLAPLRFSSVVQSIKMLLGLCHDQALRHTWG